MPYYKANTLHISSFYRYHASKPNRSLQSLPSHPPLLLHPLLTPQETILGEIELHSKRAGLHGFEIPKAVYLESEAFSGANNLLTPTQKLKRMQARDRYAAIIQELYAKRDLQHAQQARL
jgi:hypothetical protein